MITSARASESMVAAFLGAAGLQIVSVKRDTWNLPIAWALPGGVYLVDKSHNGTRDEALYCVSRDMLGLMPISKVVPLGVAVEIASTFALPPGQR